MFTYLFKGLIALCSLLNRVCLCHLPFSNWISVLLFTSELWEFLYILVAKPFWDIWFVYKFSQSVTCLFSFFIWAFAEQIFLILMRNNFSMCFYGLCFWCQVLLSRMCQRFSLIFLTFKQWIIIVLHFMFKLINNLT